MPWTFWTVLPLTLYAAGMLYLFLFSMVQLDLLFIRLTCRTRSKNLRIDEKKELPTVTIQLPVFNEKYVIDRLLEAVSGLDYPKDKLEIQILDDSTDETVSMIDAWLSSKPKENLPEMNLIRRGNQIGFKAGALQEGLIKSRSSFIAIFDADFIPPRDFLKKVIPYFRDDRTGAVQTRWGHLNENQNLLTQLQAFGLDAHFAIEQPARYCADSFLNFNGSAGVWRKSCIEDAGGWSADTLTEDLDLSFRTRLKGWKIVFDGSVVCPAELPASINSVITQQQRWNKGGAETARKLAGGVLRSNEPIRKKMHGLFQLGASSVFPALFIAAISSLLLILPPQGKFYFDFGSYGTGFTFMGLVAIMFFYAASGIINKQSFFRLMPAFLMLNMGLSWVHTTSVLNGWLGKKSPFIRTPKTSGTTGNYAPVRNKISGLTELIFGLIFLIAAVYGLKSGTSGFLILHLMMATGFLWVSVLRIHDK